MSRLIIFILPIVFLLGGCANNYDLARNTTQLTEEPCPTSNSNYSYEYKIQPQDRVSITSKTADLLPEDISDKGILVDSSGYISLPLIKRVKISGLTQSQAGKKLEHLYRRYIKKPYFNVEVLNKRAYILGEVNKPGVINIDKEKLTVLEAIAFAGDLKDNAIRENIIVISKNSFGNLTARKVDLTSFDKIRSTNLIVKPNDIVYVPANNWKKLKVTADNLHSIIAILNSVATPYLLIKSMND